MELTSTETNLFLLLFLAAALHGVYLSVLILLKSRHDTGLRMLGWMMVPASFLLINYLLYIAHVMPAFPHLLGVLTPLMYLLGPAFYFFVRRASDVEFSFKRIHLLHLLPALYIFFESIPLYLLDAQTKLSFVMRAYDPVRPSLLEMMMGNRLMLVLCGYTFAAWFTLWRFGKGQRKNIDAEARRIWLRRFTIGFSLLIVVSLLIQFLFWAMKWPGATMELALVLLISGSIYWLGYAVLGRRSGIPDLSPSVASGKYATSPVSKERMAQLITRIEHHLLEEKPWLNPKLSIGDLARALGVPSHHLSQALNEGMSVNFYDLINTYRIDEIKKRLHAGDADMYSIAGLARSCGFGSKSSFHRAFKKATGLTPTDYLKQVSPKESKPSFRG